MKTSHQRTFEVVTTCHADGFESYGRRMVETYIEHWPAGVPLVCYCEGFKLPERFAGAVTSRDLLGSSSGLAAFKRRHEDEPMAHGRSEALHWNRAFGRRKRSGRRDLRPMRRLVGYRWDAVRFSHKVFAVIHASRHTTADVLIWLDADTHFFADVAESVLESVVPAACLLGYLARKGTHSECGFVAYNLRHPAIRSFLDQMEAMYTEDLLFDELEFHDSHLFDVVLSRMKQRHATHDIAVGMGRFGGHVLINSPLGAFMDHVKGDRKAAGHSSPNDLLLDRTEPYWVDLRRLAGGG